MVRADWRGRCHQCILESPIKLLTLTIGVEKRVEHHCKIWKTPRRSAPYTYTGTRSRQVQEMGKRRVSFVPFDMGQVVDILDIIVEGF